MSVTLSDLKSHIGETSDGHDVLLTGMLAEALALVTKYNVQWDDTTEAWVASDAPTAIVDRAVTEVAADLWNRRNATNGMVNRQFATADGAGESGLRTSRDPMVPAYKLLQRWVSPW